MPDTVVDPGARDKYLLQVTAGPSYDVSTHREVAVNSPDFHIIENDLMICYLKVKVKDYHGLPRNSPATDDYFSHLLHRSDRFSIGFSFVPKKDINGCDLVTGFDFDHPIRDRLPPGFKYAMKIATTMLDPGLYGDPYSDTPYLYGPGLSSFFSFRIGEHTSEVSVDEQLATFVKDAHSVIEEGADGSGQRIRADQRIPSRISKRRKNFLDPRKLEGFTFEKGRMYQADFFNPYLDFANFALRIPGFSISVVKYIDNKTHQLRHVLKDKRTGQVLFVVIFNLLFGQSLEDTLAEREKHASAEESRPHTPTDRSSRSSYESATPSTRSSSPPESDAEDSPERVEQRETAAQGLARQIYSGFAALGFGRSPRSGSSSEESSLERETRREKPRDIYKGELDKHIDDMKDSHVEEYLKSQHSHA